MLNLGIGGQRDRAEAIIAVGIGGGLRETLWRIGVPFGQRLALGLILRGLVEHVARDPALGVDQGRIGLRLLALFDRDIARLAVPEGDGGRHADAVIGLANVGAGAVVIGADADRRDTRLAGQIDAKSLLGELRAQRLQLEIILARPVGQQLTGGEGGQRHVGPHDADACGKGRAAQLVEFVEDRVRLGIRRRRRPLGADCAGLERGGLQLRRGARRIARDDHARESAHPPRDLACGGGLFVRREQAVTERPGPRRQRRVELLQPDPRQPDLPIGDSPAQRDAPAELNRLGHRYGIGHAFAGDGTAGRVLRAALAELDHRFRIGPAARRFALDACRLDLALVELALGIACDNVLDQRVQRHRLLRRCGRGGHHCQSCQSHDPHLVLPAVFVPPVRRVVRMASTKSRFREYSGGQVRFCA